MDRTRKALTDNYVKNAGPPAKGRAEHYDALLPGFCLRVTDKGRKSWAVMYRVKGGCSEHNAQGRPCLHRATVGSYPAVKLGEARDRARTYLRHAAEGVDHGKVEEQAEAEDAERRQNTVAVVAAEFMERHVRHRAASTAAQVGEAFKRDVLPRWGKRPIDSITAADLGDLKRAILDRAEARAKKAARRRGEKAPKRAPGTSQPGAGMARRTLAHVDTFLSWCAEPEQGYLKERPARVKRPKVAARKRALGDAEVAALWTALDAVGYPFGPVFKLMLLTGQRRGEVAGMEWGEVDLEGRLWTIPQDRTKTKKDDHPVPLSPYAVRLIEGLPRIGGEYLFSVAGGRSAVGFSRAKERVDRALCEAGAAVAPWQLRDLRRTVATGLAEKGYALPHVVSAVLNHSPARMMGVTATYLRHPYMPERREALDAWGEHLRRLAEGLPADVVPIKGRKRTA